MAFSDRTQNFHVILIFVFWHSQMESYYLLEFSKRIQLFKQSIRIQQSQMESFILWHFQMKPFIFRHSQIEPFIFWHSQMESSISLFILGILKWNAFFVWHSQKESDSHTRKYSFAWHSQMES